MRVSVIFVSHSCDILEADGGGGLGGGTHAPGKLVMKAYYIYCFIRLCLPPPPSLPAGKS